MPPSLITDARRRDALTMTDGATLLSYSLLPSPDPLQVDATGATLTFVVSDPGSRVVSCTQIVVLLPVGPNAKDLTADATDIQTQVMTDGWNASRVGGVFRLSPDKSPAQIGQEGLSFVISGLGVNDQPGTANLTITETASVPSDPTPCARVGTIAVPKFPPQFTVGALTADPPDVPSGGTTTLDWTGTPSSATAPASYTLSYNPGTGPVSVPVGATGPYTSEPLTQPVVVFTLEASITVSGQDAPLVVQRQATVTVDVPAPVIQRFTGAIQPWTDGIQLRLEWATQHADGVAITGFPTPFIPSGYLTVTPTAQAPLLTSYTLTAMNATGSAAATRTLSWGAGGPTLPTGNAPGAVVVTPDGARAFVANVADNTVTVLDVQSLAVDGASIPVGKTPQAIAVTPDGARVFVANMGDNTVTVLDAQSLAVVGAPTVGNVPCGIAVTPDNTLVFVFSANDNTVTVLNAQSLTVVGAPIPVGDVPTAVAFTPDAARAFVITPDNGMVTVLDVATLTVVGKPIPVGNRPQAIAISPDGTRVFVARADTGVTVLDATTDPPTVIGSPIPAGGGACAIAVTPDGALVFVVNNLRFVSGRVTVLNPQARAVVGLLPIGKGSTGIAVSPDGTRVFVTNQDDDTVTVLVPSVTGGTGA